MLEKVAPTLLAGMPAIIKPASQTAYLTELMVRRIIEAAILPEGALQLICGNVGDLLNHVNGQPAQRTQGGACAAIPLWWQNLSVSTWRPTASMRPSSERTPVPALRNSISS
jgi:hypothetical protein